jgi:hypothetical protein
MFNIGEKDEHGRQKRIEHRGRFLRASRTGGVSLRAQTRAAGLNVTGNTRHGVRITTRLAKGTNIGLQNGRVRLRGRYGKGPTKLNLSKSGFSVSTKNKLGTFNWTNPNRSSAKVFGVQMRGKKAANLQMIYMLFALIAGLVKLLAMVMVGLFQVLAVILRVSAQLAERSGQAAVDLARAARARRLRRAGEAMLQEHEVNATAWDSATLQQALHYVVAAWGRGLSAEDFAEPTLEDGSAHVSVDPTAAPDQSPPRDLPLPRNQAVQLDSLIAPGKPRKEARQMLQVLAALARQHRESAPVEELGETLFLLDESAREVGPRTRLQDRMIDLYADCAKPVFEVSEVEAG